MAIETKVCFAIVTEFRQARTTPGIAPRKLADLVVVDRSYLLIGADLIKGIKPVMRDVGGRGSRVQGVHMVQEVH